MTLNAEPPRAAFRSIGCRPQGKESPRSSVESKGDTAEHKTGGRSDGGEEEATLEALDGEDVALVDRLEDYFASPEFTSGE